MASGDMKMKLLLDSKDFDQKLGKSKKEAKELGEAGKAGADEFSAALGKVAAKVGALVAAQATFDRAMKSSQGVARDYEIAMGTLNGVVDEFLSAIATADFSNFENGLLDIINRSNEFQESLKRLKEMQQGGSLVTLREENLYKQNKLIATNKDVALDKRFDAYSKMAASANRMIAIGESEFNQVIKSVIKAVEKETGFYDATIRLDDVISAFAAKLDMSTQDIEGVYNVAKKKREDLSNTGNFVADVRREWGYGAGSVTKQEAEKIRTEALRRQNDAIRELINSEEYSRAMLMYTLNVGFTDEEAQAIEQAVKDAIAVQNKGTELAQELTGLWSALNQELNAQVSAVNVVNPAVKAKEKIIARAMSPEQKEMLRLQQWNASHKPSDFVGVPTPEVGKLPEKIEGIDNIYDKILMNDAEEYAKKMEVWQTSVDMLSGAFKTLGSSIGGAAGEALTFAGALVDVAAQILPLIANLMAEKAAHDEVAGAAAREAASKAMSAYAGIPFAGIALGLGAVAAVMAAIKSASNIPKFADGGIVTSATLGVFGEAGPEAVLPLDKLKDYIGGNEVRVTGNIKASGKELAVVLDNYNRVRNG